MRSVAAFALTLLAAGTATAGPIGWTYSATFAPLAGEEYMYVGMEQVFPTSGGDYWINRFLPVREYGPLAGSVTGGTWQQLYTFGPQTPLLDHNPVGGQSGNWFELYVTLSDGAGHSAILAPPAGAMNVYGLGDDDTRRYVVNLSDTPQDVTLGDQRVRVSFGVGGSPESGAVMQFRVDEVPITSPEPGTIVLAGLALGGGMLARVRQRVTARRNQPVRGEPQV